MAERSRLPAPSWPRRRLAIVIVGVLLLAAAVAYALRLLVSQDPLAPDFALTDQNGQPFRLSDQRGHAIVLFFGYTHCPDVCPTTLAALARAKRKLGREGQQLDVVFVTVDPQRDTTAVLRRYIRLFDSSFIALRGTEAQLAPVYAAYHVYSQKLPAHGSAVGYLEAHSSTVDFIGPKGRIRAYGDWSDTRDQLAVKMRQAES